MTSPDTPTAPPADPVIAATISAQLIPCARHAYVGKGRNRKPGIPQWRTCPTCAWNTALIRASRIAQGHQVPDPLTQWPKATR